jgi:hypothetical protein
MRIEIDELNTQKKLDENWNTVNEQFEQSNLVLIIKHAKLTKYTIIYQFVTN